jgi:tetratricopeptide (TPR) repeat protein
MSRPRFVGLLLAVITLLVYLPATHYAFVNYDDQDYVTDNAVVQKGLSWAGIKWAFTTGHASNWHPVTWLSHMTDCELFGLNPGGHHLVNVLFHTANVVLLFALVLRWTGTLWPAAFVAALFAWHPLHVESVAWISERKDVLSTFFGLLSLLAYGRYVRCRSDPGKRDPVPMASVPAAKRGIPVRAFGLALIFYALSLMSKPMLVTLPFVMLLLDYWPFGRIPDSWDAAVPDNRRAACIRLVLEKWPFFLLAAASCVITYLVQSQRGGDAVSSFDMVPLHYRLANVLTSYGLYLLKMVWPVGLSIFYPLTNDLTRLVLSAAAAAVVLVIISIFAWRVGRTCRYFPVGWLWFLGTLVPVIGLVQVGSAALADRYSYFPSIGVFLAVTFGIRDLVARWQIPARTVAIAAALILAGMLWLTGNQLRHWRDSETLFTHALAVTKDNHVAYVNLGAALDQAGRSPEALTEFRAAEKLMPELYHIHSDLGKVLNDLGRPDDALVEYREAEQLNPGLYSLHDSIGDLLAGLGRFHEAMIEFTNAARLDPASPWPPFALGKALLQQGRDDAAIEQFRIALRIQPDNPQILGYTAFVLASDKTPGVRNGQAALVLAIRANTLTGSTQPFMLDVLGMACAETGDFTNAQTTVQEALAVALTDKMKNLGQLQQRLDLYKNHQPWRESFLFTNPPANP